MNSPGLQSGGEREPSTTISDPEWFKWRYKKKRETGNGKQESGRQETGNGRRETGDGNILKFVTWLIKLFS
ncbi:MAG: hypothetical protein KAT48_11405 [Bacteroidales bacterium]|nr:hypothetical protein [Bacteroidales bacterium]